MAYLFELNESFVDGFRRIATEQIDCIESSLNAPEVGGDQIYKTRKTLKRLRSLLRLVRPGLHDDEFRSYNNLLRTMSRRLGVFRDIDAMRETLQILKPNIDERHERYIAQLSDILSTGKNAMMRQDGAIAIERTLTDTLSLKAMVQSANFTALDHNVVGAGLATSYKTGSKRLQIAIDTNHAKSFHDCRKSVQQHWRHMQLLCNGRPVQFQPRVDAAKELAQLLGMDHDLCLVKVFAQNQIERITAKGAAAIDRHCTKEQNNLRNDAVAAGRLLFRDRADALANKVIDSWRAAAQTPNVQS